MRISADRVAAQAERILVAGRLRADAEHARRASRACRRARPPARPALPAARRRRSAASNAARSPPRPPAASPSCSRVVAAHQALQLGKFADHVGGRDRPWRDRAARVRSRGSAPIDRGESPREIARRARRGRAACRACCDRRRCASRGTRASSRILRSWSKKNRASASRARSTRSLPSMIARGSRGLEVADDEEARDELAVGVGQREVLLVLLHRQDQAFLRDREERGIERALVDGRPFDQRGHFVEQRVGHDDASRPRRAARVPATISARRSAKLGDDLALGAQRFLVGVRGRDRDVVAAQERGGRGRRDRPRGRAPSPATTSAPCSASSRCAGRTNLTSL